MRDNMHNAHNRWCIFNVCKLSYKICDVSNENKTEIMLILYYFLWHTIFGLKGHDNPILWEINLLPFLYNMIIFYL